MTTKPTWRVLGAASMPEPLHPTYDRMMSDRRRCQMGRNRNTVRSVREDLKGLFVCMKSGDSGRHVQPAASTARCWSCRFDHTCQALCGALTARLSAS